MLSRILFAFALGITTVYGNLRGAEVVAETGRGGPTFTCKKASDLLGLSREMTALEFVEASPSVLCGAKIYPGFDAAGWADEAYGLWADASLESVATGDFALRAEAVDISTKNVLTKRLVIIEGRCNSDLPRNAGCVQKMESAQAHFKRHLLEELTEGSTIRVKLSLVLSPFNPLMTQGRSFLR